jgi:hypothetical protein
MADVAQVRLALPREQYGVIVLCKDEAHQQRVYEELAGSGHEVRVVVT